MRTVYYDVENTLGVPFITGIQRVVREFSKIALSEGAAPLKHHYVPIVYDFHHSCWRTLSATERRSLLSDKPASNGFLSRLTRRFQRLLPKRKSFFLKQFQANSIFLDIESSWHSRLLRSELLPRLRSQGLALAKMHYDIIPLLYPQSTHPNTVEVFTEHFQSHLKTSDLFLCISQTTSDDVENYCQQHKLAAPTLCTIKLGAESKNHIKINKHWERQAQGFGRYLLAVGTIEPRKNHSLIIRAFDLVREQTDLNLIIVGKPGWLANEIMMQINSHDDYGSRIFHLQGIPDAQLDVLYRHAWLNVVASSYEGFGLPVIEALARGCPTVCTEAASLREFGADKVIFFKDGSADQLSEIISRLSNDKTYYLEAQEKANSFIPAKWMDCAKDIDRQLYKIKLPTTPLDE